MVAVTEANAGLHLPCQCGREIVVPSLSKLRQMYGSGPPASPARVIEEMLVKGELATTDKCTECGAQTENIIDIFCDRGLGTIVRANVITRFILFFIGGWIFVWFHYKRSAARLEELGPEILMPVRICSFCQKNKLIPTMPWALIAISLLLVIGGIAAGVYFDIVAISIPTALVGGVLLLLAIVSPKARVAENIRLMLRREPPYVRILNEFPNSQFRVAAHERAKSNNA
jgi:hypothetical protein